ncbi:MAG: IclR family transcriptional regulator [Rhodopseudomonas palustris]|uniref:IclR family transcriptional regulator n=1 Tax=Rhodopseudomonas palustris TaxID=1076 RepID=A0A933W0T0_RHOPL|nr:IclR family transcriptional regulator [Rhodopseudomonas palustris]
MAGTPADPKRNAAKPVETTVLAVERALQTIQLLSGAADGLSLAEISRELIVNKAIASRLLETLEHAGYVWRDDVAQRYHLTYRISNLGLRQLQQSGLLGQCTSVLEDLAERTGELVRLSVVERGEKITWVYAVVGTRRTLRIDPNFNFEVSLHSHATGKAWLMTLPFERAAQLVEQAGMSPLTPHTTVDYQLLRKELDTASRRGFAITFEENEIGVGAVAAPIMSPRLSGTTECVGVVSVAAPTNRMTRTQIEACGPLAAEVASRLALMWPLDERAPLRLQRPA